MTNDTKFKTRAEKWRGYAINALMFVILVTGIRVWQHRDMITGTRYMQEQGIAFPVLTDRDGALSRAWGVHAVPASFIIAPDGQIRFIEVGFTTGIGLRLRLWLAGL